LFKGLIPALLTPFTAQGKLNEEMLVDLIEYDLGLGVDGFYLCGSTGEGLLLSEDERNHLAKIAVSAVRGRVPVIVHVGHTSSLAAQRLASAARKLGAEAVASIPPFYYYYGPEEITAYYRGLKEASGLPLYFYNIPALINTSLDVDLARKLFESGTIQGMKYTHHDVLTLQAIMEACEGRLNVFSGPDEKLLQFLLMGVDGGIGTTYNCMPKLFLALYQAWKDGSIERAQVLQTQANRIINVMTRFSIIPALKAVMRFTGRDCGDPRGPFLPLDEDQQNSLRKMLDDAGFFTMESDLSL